LQDDLREGAWLARILAEVSVGNKQIPYNEGKTNTTRKIMGTWMEQEIDLF
jgi:hypothetical protein